MSLLQKFSKRLRHFGKAEQGSMATTFALSLVPLIVAMGASIDFGYFLTARTALQSSLDAASLAAASARDASIPDRQKIAKASFDRNYALTSAADYPVVSSFTISDTTVKGSASVKMPASFMSVVGITDLDVPASVQVTIPGSKKAEVAFVLDYSGSMEDVAGTEVKYIAMRNAATKLIDELTKDGKQRVKFALVPFSHHVYTSLPNAYVLGKGNSGMWTGCTQDRQYPYNLSDATPDGANGSKWGQAMAPDHAAWGCSGYVSHNLKLKPLTTDYTAVKSQLGAMTPYAWTHVALGVEFGYQVLSPNAPFNEGAAYDDKGTQKFMVVLTDGTQTEPAFGPGGVRDVSQGDKNLAVLCENAKASGITMMTLAYDLDDNTQRQRLQTCASDPAKDFFVVSTNNDLAQAFATITTAINEEVYLSK